MISFALGDQGRLHKFIKYMVQTLKINKNVPDWEGEEGRYEWEEVGIFQREKQTWTKAL